MQTSAAELAAATPTTRDRYVDFLRVVSIGVVVLGHWLMAVVEYGPDGVRATNVLASAPAAQYLTWVFQVMPLFFFVGGFAHATRLARGGSYADFIAARVDRLLRPTAVFLAVWTGLALALELTGHQDGIGKLATRTIVQPLWFVGVYLGVMALAPAMYRWHRRHGALVPVVLLGAAAGVDALRFGAGLDGIAVLNLAFVWLAAHQFGYLYADGALTRSVGAAMAVGGLVAVAILTRFYPVSMVGMPGERVSNMNPPTVALAAHAMWLIGLALLVRDPVTRWLADRRVWTVVIAANGVVMTVFLWHLTALFVGQAVLQASGLPVPPAASPGWWLSRPVWIALLALACAALVSLFRWAEQSGPAQGGGRAAVTGGGATRAAIGAAAVCVGVLGVATTGLDGMLAGRTITLVAVPMTAPIALALVAGGWALLNGEPRRCAGR